MSPCAVTAGAGAGTIRLGEILGSTRLFGSGAVVAAAEISGSIVDSTFDSEFLISWLSRDSCGNNSEKDPRLSDSYRIYHS